MGYRVDRKATLELADMDGAEVEVTIGIPISALRAWDLAEGLDAEWAVFVDAAKPTWNLEDADGPIPVGAESLTRLPLPEVRAMMRAWRDAVVNPPAPLSPPSGSTAT